MTSMEEREVLREFIEVYRDHPCLWDMNCELYRNKELKHEAWGLMTGILRKLDPDANLGTTKKKVENLRAVYFRELKKVRASELNATHETDVFVPNLWYFKMISFLDSKEWGPGHSTDPLRCDIKQAPTSDEESVESAELLVLEEPEIPVKRKSFSSQGSARKVKKKEPIIQSIQTFVEPLHFEQTYQEQKTQKTNYFGVYVGEQLDQVSTFQRHVAERLISEVLFLAKTGNLNYESKIESKVSQYERKVEVEEESERPTLLKELLIDGRL